MALTIDVISDVVCPWCFIGKRRLAEALALRARQNPGAAPPAVAWHPFQLNPGLPVEGVDRTEYYRQKFGDRVPQVLARVREAGREAGVELRLEAIRRQPNTAEAHALIAAAADEGVQDAVVEAFFRAFFVDGIDLTERANLAAVAAAAGLSRDGIAAALESDAVRARVAAAQEAARRIGVEGVPFFIFNRRLAVSGAQAPEVLAAAMREAEAD